MNKPAVSCQTQTQATEWFAHLRDRICATLESLEDRLAGGNNFGLAAGRFMRKDWSRAEGGGGTMALMRGRVFEKAGVNVSTVYGTFSDVMRKEVPGAAEHPYFWASGISLVLHPWSPHVPAVHMNTRMIALSSEPWSAVRGDEGETLRGGVLYDDPAQRGGAVAGATPRHLKSQTAIPEPLNGKKWFGGGADLTPMGPPDGDDSAAFHAAFKACCDRFSPDYYAKYKQWCDEYFFLKHRGESRGIGGIFYDYLDSGDVTADFAFTRGVGETLLAAYPPIVERHMQAPWTKEQRDHQRMRRGRYVEFNLLYDRGTRFGLMTGGNTEAILMSLPPDVAWP